MANDGAPQGGENNDGQGNAQGAAGGQGTQGQGFDAAAFTALQQKVQALEKDNFNYREKLRQSGGGNANGESNGAQNQGGAQGEATSNGKSEREVFLERQLITQQFQHNITTEAAKRGALQPNLVAKVASMAEYADEQGNLKDAEATFTELKLLYPHLFQAVQGSADGGAGGESARSAKSFSDQIREDLKSRTGR